MIGNNLSQLGVDAGQLDSGLDALALQVAWMPTTPVRVPRPVA